MQARKTLGQLKRVGANANLARIGITMTTAKSLLVAALLSTVAAVSFAQTPAAAKATTGMPTRAAATAPANETSKPLHHKKHHKAHHAKKASAKAPAAAAAK
jgi:hypothetical protein